jgi:transcriptional regulator with XRE-family HTH domain
MNTIKLRSTDLPPFALNLRVVMAERRMTQQDLANRLGVSHRAVSAWCRGENIPHRRTAEKLSGLFARSVDWFSEAHS